jgi:hypothetical protein
MEREMLIALRRGELVEKEVVLRQASFSAECLKGQDVVGSVRMVAADPEHQRLKVAVERLKEMMVSVLEEVSELPARVTDPNWVADEDCTPFADDDQGNGDGTAA